MNKSENWGFGTGIGIGDRGLGVLIKIGDCNWDFGLGIRDDYLG